MDKKGKFEKMAEMMKNCCTGEGDMADCCYSRNQGARYVIIKHGHFMRCL